MNKKPINLLPMPTENIMPAVVGVAHLGFIFSETQHQQPLERCLSIIALVAKPSP